MSAATLLLLWAVGLAAESHVRTQHFNRRLPKAELRFGLKLLKELSPAGHTGGRNTLFSPAGISAALGMVYAGAGGKSEKQLSNVLGYEKVGLNTRDKVMKAYNQSLADFLSPGAALGIANAALIDESFSVLDGYKKDLVRTFDAWLCSVDFIDNSNGVTSQINDWVKAKTNGMIPKMINEDVDSNALLLLLNAISFKGTWHYAFDPSKTELLPFYDYRSQAHPVETMRSVVS